MDYGTQVCMVFNSSYVRKTLKTPNGRAERLNSVLVFELRMAGTKM